MGFYDCHFLQYNIIINDDAKNDQIKEAIKKICENRKMKQLNLFRQRSNGMKFIELFAVFEYKQLVKSKYVQQIDPFKWMDEYSTYRKKIDDNMGLDLDDDHNNLLNDILNSELKDHIISHGWYDVSDPWSTYD